MNAPYGAPQKIRLDTQRSKYDVICHLLSSGCAEPCLFLGTDAYLPCGPSPPRWGRILVGSVLQSTAIPAPAK
jgi:hypothetical protein